MSVARAPSLADGLRAALLARAPSLSPTALPRDAFVSTMEMCDAADRAYRASIVANLGELDAGEVLAVTNAFRARVRTVRANALAEAARIHSGDDPNRTYDPLDVVTPRIEALSHVAAVRLADVSDRARAEVAALRTSANARIGPVLAAGAREALTEAKRARLAAFRGAVHAALVPFAASVDRYSDTVESLASLADGWY